MKVIEKRVIVEGRQIEVAVRKQTVMELHLQLIYTDAFSVTAGTWCLTILRVASRVIVTFRRLLDFQFYILANSGFGRSGPTSYRPRLIYSECIFLPRAWDSLVNSLYERASW
jgi:hypothetical protein